MNSAELVQVAFRRQNIVNNEVGSELLALEVVDADTDHFVLVDFGDFGVHLLLDPVDHVLLLLVLQGVFDRNLLENFLSDHFFLIVFLVFETKKNQETRENTRTQAFVRSRVTILVI